MRIVSTSPVSIPFLPLGAPVHSPTFEALVAPLETVLPTITPLVSSSNRQITFTFEYPLRSLIYYHISECTSAQKMLQKMTKDPFVRHLLVSEGGLGESTFYEANTARGEIQMLEVFDRLSKKVFRSLGLTHMELGDLLVIDGSLIEVSFSMTWKDYSSSQNKAKVHLGFDLNRSIPRQVYLTAGNGPERLFASRILQLRQTGVLDRGYQDHSRFDLWIESDKHFVARLEKNTQWEIQNQLPFVKGGKVFFFAQARLGDKNHQMNNPVYLVGYRVRRKVYWMAY